MSYPQWLQTTVESSLLLSVAYSTDTILELRFCSGAIYRYFAVPPAVFESLLAAESKGNYFNRNIRNRFSCQRVA